MPAGPGRRWVAGRTPAPLQVCSVALFVARTPSNRLEEGWKADKDSSVGPQAWEEEGGAQARDSATGWRGGARDLRQRRM